MGNAGQAALTVVGTVVGAYFGYPQLGFALGSLAGQALFPTKLPTVSGPRLSDLAQTQSTVGAPIPKGWGTFPATGCIIAKSDVREVISSEDVGGKGGPSQTVETPTYYNDFAVGLNDGLIAGVRRIWANGKIIYDRRPQQLGESSDAFSSRMAANDMLDQYMVVYLGSETQLPDPTLETVYGVGNVSAFRGLAYIVFINWLNKPEDGNKMPLTWRFECFTSGALNDNELTEYSNEVLYPWLELSNPVNPLNTNTYIGACPIADIESTNFNEVFDAQVDVLENDNPLMFNTYPGGFGYYVGYASGDSPPSVLGTTEGYLTQAGAATANEYESRLVYLYHGLLTPTDVIAITPPGLIPSLDEVSGAPGGAATSRYIFTNTSAPAGCEVAYTYLFTTEDAPPGFVTLSRGDGTGYIIFPMIMTPVERTPAAPIDPLDDPNAVPVPGTTEYVIIDGILKKTGPWEEVNGTFKVLANFYAPDDKVLQYPLNPTLPVGHADYNSREFWETAYIMAAAVGTMPAGLEYGVDYPETRGSAYRRVLASDSYDVGRVPLSDILTDIHLEAGYSLQDFDVSDLEETFVIGFVRTGPTPPRGVIEALRPIGMFDPSEDQGVLRYIRRGKGVVATVGTDDLGVTQYGETPPSKVTVRNLMDYDIACGVRLHYLSYERDYDIGEALSPIRTDTDSTQMLDLDTTVVLEEQQASGVVESMWADLWASSTVYQISLDMSSWQYRPTDCLAVPVDGRYVRMRIGSSTEILPVLRQFELVRDDSDSFISYAIASTPPVYTDPAVTPPSPVTLVLMDLPLLRDQDNDAGVYAAATPLIAGATFKGAVIMRATTENGNYQRIIQISSAAIIGTVGPPLDEVDASVVDYDSVLTVVLPSGSLENRTMEDVLLGANAAAIGVDGRWEIIQFTTAVEIIEGVWELTGLLRGRRGTEWAMGTGQQGDTFVLLNAITRVPLDITLVNRENFYKCVPTGLGLDTAVAQSFTGRGVALKPFSPTNIEGSRDPVSGAWTITWLRRGRIGQTLQSGVDVALSEEVEDYEVEILDDDDTVIRTISVSAEQAVYSLSKQTIDFGAGVSTLRVKVYQISTAVGRGTAGTATITA
jgi:hypothetical protein